jgi:hypothetical protein
MMFFLFAVALTSSTPTGSTNSELPFLCSSILDVNSSMVYKKMIDLRGASEADITRTLDFKCEATGSGFIYQLTVNGERFSNTNRNLIISNCTVDPPNVEFIHPVAALLLADYCGGDIFDTLPIVNSRRRLSEYLPVNNAKDIDLTIDSRADPRILMFSYYDFSHTKPNAPCLLYNFFVKICRIDLTTLGVKSMLLGFLKHRVVFVQEARVDKSDILGQD